LRRSDSHIVVRGRVFSVVASEGKNQRLLESADELVATLSDDFGLIAPEAADLWDKICERHAQISAQK